MMMRTGVATIRLPRNALCGFGMGAAIPYGAGTYYDTESGTYKISGQSGSYATPHDLEQALYKPEETLLATQTPQAQGVMVGSPGPGMVYAPEEKFYTLPGGQQIEESTYLQAVAAGTLPELIHQYTDYGTERAAGTYTPPAAAALPTAPAVVTAPATTPVAAAPSTPQATTAAATQALETATGMPLTTATKSTITLPYIGEVSTTTLLIAAGAVVGLILITKGGK